MALSASLSQGYSAGGSENYNTASSWSQTNAAEARAWSEQQATVAFERQRQLMQEQQAYNSAEAALAREFNRQEAETARTFNAGEAQKTRDWETEMANSIYTRSAENMKKAGINPILAYNMGLTGAGVGSGATASISPASGSGATASMGSAPLAQNFMDSSSASEAMGHGSSWNSSESGLATGLQALGDALAGALATVNSGMNLQIDLGNWGNKAENVGEYVSKLTIKEVGKALKDFLNDPGSYTGNGKGTSQGDFYGSGKHINKKRGTNGTF